MDDNVMFVRECGSVLSLFMILDWLEKYSLKMSHLALKSEPKFPSTNGGGKVGVFFLQRSLFRVDQ